MPELLGLLKHHGQLKVDAATCQLLCKASTSTIERNLKVLRRGLETKRMSQTKPGTLLRKQIPVVVGRWRELDSPGYTEVDLVSHSGENAVGEWIWTLCLTDLSTGWTLAGGDHGKRPAGGDTGLGQGALAAAIQTLGDSPRLRKRVHQHPSPALLPGA